MRHHLGDGGAGLVSSCPSPGFLGAAQSRLPLRPLKNVSDGALMDDNQNEWGDEDLEAKKFRVSPVGSRDAQGASGAVTLHDTALCCPTLKHSSRNRWFFLTWMTKQTTGSGPSSTWMPPTCVCLPWHPRHRRARSMPTAWM